MRDELFIVVGCVVVAFALRALPEVWLKGRQPPVWLADAFEWLPVSIAATFVGIAHFGADSAVRPEFALAGVLAALSLLMKRSFFIPVLVGVVTVAAYRALVP